MYMDLIQKLIEKGKINDDRTYGKGETSADKSVTDSKGSKHIKTTSIDGSGWKTPQCESFDSTKIESGRKNSEIAKELKEQELTTIMINKGIYHLNKLFENKVNHHTSLSKYLVQYTLNSKTKILGQYKVRITNSTKMWLFMWGKEEITGIDVSDLFISLGKGLRQNPAKEARINYYDLPALIKKGLLITGEKWQLRDVPELEPYIIQRNLKNN